MARADLELRDGTRLQVVVPLLYAGSTVAADAALRTGGLTTWEYLGGARGGCGQRDLVVDGGRMIGITRVVSIAFDGAAAEATAPSRRDPLPSARVADLRPRLLSPRTKAALAMAAAVVVAVLLGRAC